MLVIIGLLQADDMIAFGYTATLEKQLFTYFFW